MTLLSVHCAERITATSKFKRILINKFSFSSGIGFLKIFNGPVKSFLDGHRSEINSAGKVTLFIFAQY